MSPLIFWILTCIPFGLLTRLIARRKGWSGKKWFALGLIFGLVGLITAIGLPDLVSRDYLKSIAKHFARREQP
tara:strand:- start:441 stop:659 length:219 start_codon:yes stop_codon:yes gene_type:complete